MEAMSAYQNCSTLIGDNCQITSAHDWPALDLDSVDFVTALFI